MMLRLFLNSSLLLIALCTWGQHAAPAAPCSPQGKHSWVSAGFAVPLLLSSADSSVVAAFRPAALTYTPPTASGESAMSWRNPRWTPESAQPQPSQEIAPPDLARSFDFRGKIALPNGLHDLARWLIWEAYQRWKK